MTKNWKELFDILNADPDEVEDGVSEDGRAYKYIPIAKVYSLLDHIFGCDYDFDLDREVFGKGAVSGKGTLTVRWGSMIIKRSGTAGMPYREGVKLDYPTLESYVLRNAAKKLGSVFGRDLNKDKDDKLDKPEIPSYEEIQKEQEIDEQYQSLLQIIKDQCETKEQALLILSKSDFSHNMFLKELANSKPSKNNQ